MLACRATTLVFASLLALTGCTQPEEEFNNFKERYEPIYPPVVIGGCTQDPCTPPAPADADGAYLFALSAALDRTHPVLLDTQVTFDGSKLSMTTQPLNAMDRMTKVGMPVMLGPFDVAPDGCFDADFPPLTVPGEANPISGNEIVADVRIIGRLCAMPGGFFCGDLDGVVTSLGNLSLSGSTFTVEKLAMPGVYPEPPKINCNQDLAAPL